MKKTFTILSAVLFFLGIVSVDFATKRWALATLGQPIRINRFVSCELTINRGISWGFFHHAHDYVYVSLSIIIIGMIIALVAYAAMRYKQGHTVIFETMIIAGACGNLLDRFLYKGVVDFILISYHRFAFPIFNIADVAIICGAFCCVLLYYE